MSMRFRATWTSLAALSLAAVVSGDDWNTGAGGDSSRSCLSREVGPTAATRLWTGSRSGIVAQQACIGHGLAVMNRIESFTIPTGTWIVAHDLATGAIQWETQLPYDFPGTSWRSRASAIRDGVVYATRAGNTNDDYLYALDIADGSVVWQSEGLVDEGSTESVAFTANGDIIAGNFDSIMRIDRTDGSTVWTTSRSCPTSNGCQVAVSDERAYYFEASADGPILTVLDVNTGAELYASKGIGGGFVQQVGPFVGPDGTVYAPRTQNNIITDFLVAFDDTGSALVERWRTPIGYVPFATFGVGPDGSVYNYLTTRIGSEAELTLQRLDSTTGAVIDESDIILTNYPAQPRMAIDAMGTVYLTNGGFSNGGVFAFDASLNLLWTESITNVNVGGPALGPDGIMVVCGVGTDVRAYQTNDRLTLNAPEPGEPGTINTLRVRGSMAGGNRIALVYGLNDGSEPVPGCPGLFADINAPQLAAILTSDASGAAETSQFVPAQASGVTVLIQAVDLDACETSNLIRYGF